MPPEHVVCFNPLQAQYLPHKGELSALVNKNRSLKESPGEFKVSGPEFNAERAENKYTGQKFNLLKWIGLCLRYLFLYFILY